MEPATLVHPCTKDRCFIGRSVQPKESMKHAMEFLPFFRNGPAPLLGAAFAIASHAAAAADIAVTTLEVAGAGYVRAWGRPDIGAFEFRGDTIFSDGFELNDPPTGCSS
jgi:hypothetical protein